MSSELERDIERLGDRWGFVVITHHPDYDDDFRWVVANHTDEGLGDGDNVESHGESLREAVDKALEGDYFEW